MANESIARRWDRSNPPSEDEILDLILPEIDYVEQTLASIVQLENEIQQLWKEITLRERWIKTWAADRLRKSPVDRQRELMNRLYWEHGDYIKPALIVDALQITYTLLRSRVKRKDVQRNCQQCGAAVSITAKSINDARTREVYCAACAAQRNKNARERQLQWEAAEGERRALYVAEKEARRIRLDELRSMPYAEYLQTPEWRERRKDHLRNALYRCELCFSQDRLNVHHKTYERRGYEDDKDLIVLCEKCHAKFHDKLAPEDQ